MRMPCYTRLPRTAYGAARAASGSCPSFGRWPFPVRGSRRALLSRHALRVLRLHVCQMPADRDIVACNVGRPARGQSHTNGFLAGAAWLCSVQDPADGHEQLGSAQAVMEALAFPQAPVRPAYHAFVTVAECPPDDMRQSQLPADRAQFIPRGQQQRLPQLGTQCPAGNEIFPACAVAYHAAPVEDG